MIFVGCPEQIMMWCLVIFSHGVDLRDDGFWKVVDDAELCSFIFTAGQHSWRFEML